MILSGFWILMVIGSLVTAMGIIVNWVKYMMTQELSHGASATVLFGLLIVFSALTYSPFRMELIEQMEKGKIG